MRHFIPPKKSSRFSPGLKRFLQSQEHFKRSIARKKITSQTDIYHVNTKNSKVMWERIRLRDVMKQINMKIVLNKFREVNVWIDLPPSFIIIFFNIWIPADECRHLSYGKTINHFPSVQTSKIQWNFWISQLWVPGEISNP